MLAPFAPLPTAPLPPPHFFNYSISCGGAPGAAAPPPIPRPSNEEFIILAERGEEQQLIDPLRHFPDLVYATCTVSDPCQDMRPTHTFGAVIYKYPGR